MSRFIVAIGQSTAGGGLPTAAQEDGYLDRVAKYIPAEILAAYVALLNIAQGVTDNVKLRTTLFAISAVICFVLTPLYLWFRATAALPKVRQIVISSLAFVVWSYALGGIWSECHIQVPAIASTLLIIFTLLSGVSAPKVGEP